jgi:hypothetical protein
MALSKQLLNILVCPICHTKLDYHADQYRLDCPTCKLGYPVTEDVPVLLSDEAKPLK